MEADLAQAESEPDQEPRRKGNPELRWDVFRLLKWLLRGILPA